MQESPNPYTGYRINNNNFYGNKFINNIDSRTRVSLDTHKIRNGRLSSDTRNVIRYLKYSNYEFKIAYKITRLII